MPRWSVGQESLQPPRGARERLLATFRPSSQRSYRRALALWDRWLARRSTPTIAAQYDALLWEYASDLSRSAASTVIAAIARTIPPLKHRLPWCRALLNSLHEGAQIEHYVPMPWFVALLLAYGLVHLRQHSWAAVLSLHREVGTRPSEVLKLRGTDLRPATANVLAPGLGVLNLGASGGGTKIRRNRAITVRVQTSLLLVDVLCR